MARPKIKRKGFDWRNLLSEEKDLLKGAVQDMVPEILARPRWTRRLGRGKASGVTERDTAVAVTTQPSDASRRSGIATAARPTRSIGHHLFIGRFRTVRVGGHPYGRLCRRSPPSRPIHLDPSRFEISNRRFLGAHRFLARPAAVSTRAFP